MCERCAQVDPKKRPSISELIDSFYKDYYCDIHIHGLNKYYSYESYLQQLSEVNVIETTKSIHSQMFKQYWVFIAEYDNIYSQDCLSQIYLKGLFLPRDIVKYFHYSSLVKRKMTLLIFIYQVKKLNLISIKLFIFFTRAAKKNYPNAQLSLGNIYYYGRYCKKKILKKQFIIMKQLLNKML